MITLGATSTGGGVAATGSSCFGGAASSPVRVIAKMTPPSASTPTNPTRIGRRLRLIGAASYIESPSRDVLGSSSYQLPVSLICDDARREREPDALDDA